jgi:pimeloyl-ACP methyl ester carboxylesterase
MEFLSDIRRFRSAHQFSEVPVGKHKFRYILCGAGKETVTLLTGGMGLAELNFRFIEKLEQQYRVLAFDYPLGIDRNAKLAKAVSVLIRKLIHHFSEYFPSQTRCFLIYNRCFLPYLFLYRCRFSD